MREDRNNRTEEDFVWVNMSEVERGSAICESLFEVNTVVQSPLDGTSTNIVQSRVKCLSSKEESPDQSDYDSDLLPDDEEKLEAYYIDHCAEHKNKPLQPKLKYPKPYWMKIYERGIYNIEKRVNEKRENENKCSSRHKNSLLPKIKLDASTTQVLEMLMNHGYLGQCNELVYNGKKTMVFSAFCSRHNCITTPFDIAVKIYKLKKDEEQNNIIYKQVQREFEHLKILHDTKGLRDQSIFAVRARKNVILMGFVGSDNWPAVTIDNCSSQHNQAMYNDIIDYMDRCYNIGNLIHGNLSAKKILCRNSSNSAPLIWFIGWSHSVKRNHPMALPKLMKDCYFVTEFFKRRDVAVQSTLDLYKQITRQDTVNAKLLEIIQSKDLFEKYNTNPNRRSKSLAKPITNKRFK
ncbi:serine/threonine-protein kinase RIO1-like isoform X1 [Cydia pomonella]|uniref:serine/threonine-protein kinase RIO1-like isoform X1 n=1 Tax=Cydia pomonella TaxID=82600 RepID=UPI002ADE1143|nr:serine/threonine-protein kinase RIO1-like isoform X1 [Cydia pomonella]